MEIKIDEHIEVLKSYHNGFTGYAGNLQDSIDVAVDIMCKYQNIEDVMKDYRSNPIDCLFRIRRILER